MAISDSVFLQSEMWLLWTGSSVLVDDWIITFLNPARNEDKESFNVAQLEIYFKQESISVETYERNIRATQHQTVYKRQKIDFLLFDLDIE